MQTWNYR